MDADPEKLVRYIAACQNMAGVVLATTLTGFIFLVTRRQSSQSTPNGQATNANVDLMGPFCLLFSFIFGLASFIVFSVMMRSTPGNFCPEAYEVVEFNSWLSPFHLMLMTLYLSMTSLAYGTYYVTRDWLWFSGTPSEVTPSQLTILRTVYLFALFGPVLVFLYFAITVAELWGTFIFNPPYVAGVAYVAATAFLLLVFVSRAARGLTKGGLEALGLMRTTLLVAFASAGLQLIQNVLWQYHILLDPVELGVELGLVVLRTFLVGYVVVCTFHFIREDYAVFRQALRT
jgi:hypothetical protein